MQELPFYAVPAKIYSRANTYICQSTVHIYGFRVGLSSHILVCLDHTDAHAYEATSQSAAGILSDSYSLVGTTPSYVK